MPPYSPLPRKDTPLSPSQSASTSCSSIKSFQESTIDIQTNVPCQEDNPTYKETSPKIGQDQDIQNVQSIYQDPILPKSHLFPFQHDPLPSQEKIIPLSPIHNPLPKKDHDVPYTPSNDPLPCQDQSNPPCPPQDPIIPLSPCHNPPYPLQDPIIPPSPCHNPPCPPQDLVIPPSLCRNLPCPPQNLINSTHVNNEPIKYQLSLSTFIWSSLLHSPTIPFVPPPPQNGLVSCFKNNQYPIAKNIFRKCIIKETG